MKNSIYAGISNSSSVVVNGIVPLTTVIHRENGNSSSEIDLVGNAIVIETGCRCRPRYNIDAKITFTGATAGLATLSIYKNGVAIPLASASETITTPTTEVRTVTIPCGTLTDKCSNNVYTIVNTGAIAITVSNASINVVEQ